MPGIVPRLLRLLRLEGRTVILHTTEFWWVALSSCPVALCFEQAYEHDARVTIVPRLKTEEQGIFV